MSSPTSLFGSQTRRAFLGRAGALGALAASARLSGRFGSASVRAQEMARTETLYVAGWQWGPPNTFNPLNPNRAWPSNPDSLHIYETLFAFNLFTGEAEPLLAKEMQWPDPQTVVITLQDGTKFSDGTPLTSADVIYSFELPKRHDGIYYSDFWDYISSAEATDERTITLKLNPERLNPGMVRHHLCEDYILPKHIWEQREASGEPLIEVIDVDPVGSGPYKVLDASTERIALVRDDNYWGAQAIGLPTPRYIIHPIFDSNDSANLAFSRGEIDISQTFLPQIWQLWESRGQPVGTWFREEPYHVPGSIPLLFINVNRKPLDDPRVRRALAYSINYPQIAATAMSRYSVPANSSLIIPDGGEAKFFNADLVAREGWTYDPERAKAILEQELGATKDGDVYVLPDGTRLGPFVAHCPYGWTDWQTAIELVAQGAREVGFDVQTDFPEAPVVTTRNQAGDFDLALWYVAGVSAAGPWRRFRDVLDNRGVAELGQPAFWNYNRYKNDAVGPLLDQAAQADEAGQIELYQELDAIFMRDVPAIPLMYRPDEFYEYNETVWTGFPNEENPVGPPAQQGAGIKSLSKLTLKSES
ncbi:MAG TPA: ABC transporter substrate-binding protein [Thermomicrobiales bacterium]